MVIPNWLNKYLTSSDLLNLEQAIADTELLTEAEIIPVIVRSSSSYSYLKINLMLLTTLILTMGSEAFSTHLYWDHGLTSLIFIGLVFIFVFFITPWLASLDFIKKMFVMKSEMLEQSFKRAKLEFYENKIHHTKDSVGVLIFISMLERQVIVLADQKISNQLPPDTWQKAVDTITKNLKTKELSKGLNLGLKELSLHLAEHFPIGKDDINELSNQLVIKE
jgi:putative membrane protein